MSHDPGQDRDAADPRTTEVTELVRAAAAGDRSALDELFAVVYGELKTIARAQRSRWEGSHTLQTTVLVHEAYMKLVRQDGAGWRDRAHFFATAARAIRHILVNYAEERQAQKRGGGLRRVELDAAFPLPEPTVEDILVIDDALDRLADLSERQSRVVECRFFAGLTVEETAEALSISPATVYRDWALGSAWLRRALGPDENGGAR